MVIIVRPRINAGSSQPLVEVTKKLKGTAALARSSSESILWLDRRVARDRLLPSRRVAACPIGTVATRCCSLALPLRCGG